MEKNDYKKAALKNSNHEFLIEIIKEGYFEDNVQAYIFFISYALSKDIKLTDDEILVSRSDEKDTNLDDYDRKKFENILDVIRGVYIDDSIREKFPVRIMNGLADKSIDIIRDSFWNKKTKELDLKNILNP